MKKLRILYSILKITGMMAAINGFLVFFLGATFAIEFVEPGITSYQDAAWYLFASFTTIGYGDLAAVTLLGRIITIVVSLYGILIVAFIPAVIIAYTTEFSKAKQGETMLKFMDKLEHLPELTKDELESISSEVKKGRYKL